MNKCTNNDKGTCFGDCGPWCTGFEMPTLENVEGEIKIMEKQIDIVQQPEHYRQGKYQVIDEMLIVFGPKKTFDFCILNAWKYRARAPFKNKMEEDMAKSSRYLEMAKQIADTYEEVGYEKILLIKEEDNGTGQ